MINIILYRRDNISLAYTENGVPFGVNLDIWFGYTGVLNEHTDMIVSASKIKQEMAEDLAEFDHIKYAGENKDILQLMCHIGRDIFNTSKTKGRHLLDEIQLYNCYSDKVTINSRNILCDILFYKKNDEIIRLNQNNKIAKLFNDNVDLACLSLFNNSKIPLDEELIHSFFLENNDNGFISYIDFATKNRITQKYNNCTYITVTCVENIQHSLSECGDILGKCINLHGHSYICSVSIKMDKSIDRNSLVLKSIIIELDEDIRRTLHLAFGYLKNKSTCENITLYTAQLLCKKYCVTEIEIMETSNIKVKIKYG